MIAAAALLVIAGAPLAAADTGDFLREGVRNGTASKETELIATIAGTNAIKGGYSMRLSNRSLSGGGAIYGCRAGTSATSKPCVRANNLSTGRAFEFHSMLGSTVGLITAGDGGDDKKPFTTNATGIATGLNADRLDGLHAADLLAQARAKAGLAAATADTATTAVKAGDADTLDGLDSTAFVPASKNVSFRSKLAIGAEREIAKAGTLTLVHQCIDHGAGDWESRIIARTSAPGAITEGVDVHDGTVADGTLEPSTLDDDSELLDNTSDETQVEGEIDSGFAESADLEDHIRVDENTGLGVRFAGANCTAVGIAEIV